MAFNRKTALALTLLVPTVVLGAQTRRSAATSIAITDVTLIDGTGTSAQPHMNVASADGRVIDIAPTARFKPRAGAQIIDASDKFAIPGLRDMHVHSVSYDQAKAALPAVLAAPVGGLAGDWKGTWTRDGDALPVTATFAKTGDVWSGTFDSDALQVSGVPFSEVSDINGNVSFRIKGDRTTTSFDGAIASDAISGTFTDENGNGVFALERATRAAAQVRTRDVTFQDNGITLGGTLLMPGTPGRHPAIVFLHGSGPEARWANRYLAQTFAERGIVALIYDKRGVGQSTGDWQNADFGALADDAAAGVRFLRAQSEVDGTRLGVYGHSQGGTIAPLLGERVGDLRFIIASAAGGIDPADVETYSVRNVIGIEKLPPAERADAESYIRALIDVAYRGKDRAPLDAIATKFKGRGWFFAPPPPDNFYWSFSRRIAAFRPAAHWSRIKASVLLVYGAHDERVPPRQGANAIQAALRAGGNRRVTLKMYPNADHTFTIVEPPHKGGWPRHEPDYAETLGSWILAQK
jgi:dienelactone hydrolase